MTQTLTLVRSRQPRDDVAPSRGRTSAISRDVAREACELFFARIAPAGRLAAEDRRAMIDAVLEILPVASGRPLPVCRRPSLHLHLRVEGWAYRAQTLRDGARQITDVLLPGDFCGWAPSASADLAQEIRASGAVRVAVLRMDVIAGRALSALERGREWARDAEARILRSRVVSLGRRDARGRVAHFISEVHDRLRRVGLAEGGVFTCPLTQEQLADVLGLTTVHVNRVLQRIRYEGLAVFNKRRVSILDLAGLHAAAGFEEAGLI
jgi:CRP-like cAMP-binding protein